MISKDQAMKLTYRDELHFQIATDKCVKTRVNGQCKTWKTRPEDFRVPMKVGFSGYSEIVPGNANGFHLPADCPVCGIKSSPGIKQDAATRRYAPGNVVRMVTGKEVQVASWPFFEGEGDDRMTMVKVRAEVGDPTSLTDIRYFSLVQFVREGTL